MILDTGLFHELYINDFLESNFVIYQGFFGEGNFDFEKLKKIKNEFNERCEFEGNYYSKNFGGNFFSLNDALKIGQIRDELDELLKNNKINKGIFHPTLKSNL